DGKSPVPPISGKTSVIDVLKLARQLIDIPSTTDHERDVAEFLDRELTQLGYTTRRNEVSDSRFNLYASTVERPRVVINSHIDTVPPWFVSREDDEFIYGRGACDTKGIIAAMIAAGEELRVRGVEKPNVIAGSAECELLLRLVGEPDEARERLESLVKKFGGTITLTRGNPPQHMVVPDGAPSTIVSFNTDVPWLSNLGKPLL